MKVLICILLVWLAGCAQILGLDDYKIVDDTDTTTATDNDDTGSDAPTDTGSDAPTDTGSDTPTDTGSDTPTDTGSDTPTDTETDTTPDCVVIPGDNTPVDMASDDCAIVDPLPGHKHGETITISGSNCETSLSFDWSNCETGSAILPGGIYSTVDIGNGDTACPLILEFYGTGQNCRVQFW